MTNAKRESVKESGISYNLRILVRLLAFLLPYKTALAVQVLSLIGITILLFAVPWFAGQALDGIRGNPTSLPFTDTTARPDTVSFLVMVAVAILLLGIARGALFFVQTYLSQTVSQGVAYDIRNALYAALQKQSFSFYDKASTADLMSRATADVEAARRVVAMGLPRPIRTFIFFLLILVFLWNISPFMAVIALVGIPFIAYRAVITTIRLRPIWQAIQERLSDLTVVLQESLSGAKVVRSFGRQDLETLKFQEKTFAHYKVSMEGTDIRSFNSALMTFIVYVLIGVSLAYGGREIIGGRMTDGQLLQTFLYFVMLTEQVRMLGMMGDLFSRSVAAGQRIFEVLDAEPDIRDRPGAVTLDAVEGVVGFENVSFSYTSFFPTLTDVSLEARPDEVVALLGATGSGKTTLISLIPRFYDISAGRVTIDSLDVRDVTLDSLRRTIGIVQQDVFLFSDTIRSNIAYGRPEASEEEIVRVAQAARLHGFIMSLPNSYDTEVGERGITLSGGQRQRLAIARTLLLDPRVLILDDSLSSVDMETSYLIQQALAEVMKGRTTFVIAQRLATLKQASQILVLDDGRIVERGTHDALLEHGRLYKEIYDLQLRQQEEALEAVHKAI